MKRTYDEIQMAATLTYCLGCLCWFYMTHPRPVCISCRRAYAQRVR